MPKQINTDKYQVINGVSYKKEASSAVIQTLEDARQNNIRIAILCGDVKTGKAWNGGAFSTGYVGLNNIGLPILLCNKNSGGGVCIMDTSILEIREIKSNKSMYKWEMNEVLIVEETLEQVSESDSKAIETSAIFS